METHRENGNQIMISVVILRYIYKYILPCDVVVVNKNNDSDDDVLMSAIAFPL